MVAEVAHTFGDEEIEEASQEYISDKPEPFVVRLRYVELEFRKSLFPMRVMKYEAAPNGHVHPQNNGPNITIDAITTYSVSSSKSIPSVFAKR